MAALATSSMLLPFSRWRRLLSCWHHQLHLHHHPFWAGIIALIVLASWPLSCWLELYPDSVFWYGIGWYFLGIFLTNTKGKLGKDVRYCTFGGNPFFPRFCPLFDGPSPPLRGVPTKFHKMGSHQILQYKKYRTYHTEYTNWQVPVTYQYRPNCQ
jgi:hypothetical protein